jgi:ABC-type uncharacterized transport system substrate-binding protein
LILAGSHFESFLDYHLNNISRYPSSLSVGARAQGFLISYAVDPSHIFRRAALYVDKIFKGASLPSHRIEQPTKFVLVVNLQTAKAIGITIPESILLRADEVIR